MKLPDQSSARTDAIRQRRERQSHAARQAVKDRKSHSAVPSMPPVMMRTRMIGISGDHGKKTRNSRRRYNFSVDRAHGAEISIPALPNLALSWRMLSFVLVALLGYGLYTLWMSPSFRVEKPAVSGLTRLTTEQIASELDLAGKPVFLLNTQQIRASILKTFPEVTNAEVAIALPNTVFITVTERVPVLMWIRDNMNYLVDEDGNIYPMRSSGQDGSYPTIFAMGDPPAINMSEVDKKDQKKVALEQLAGVLTNELLPQNEIRPLLTPSMVKAILFTYSRAPEGAKLIFDPIHGLGWTDRRGWNVYLGKDQDIEIKLQEYRAIMDKLKSIEIQPEMISVENIHAPYYRING